MYKVATPITVKISNSVELKASFFWKNISTILATENHEFSKNKIKLDEASNFYEFSK